MSKNALRESRSRLGTAKCEHTAPRKVWQVKKPQEIDTRATIRSKTSREDKEGRRREKSLRDATHAHTLATYLRLVCWQERHERAEDNNSCVNGSIGGPGGRYEGSSGWQETPRVTHGGGREEGGGGGERGGRCAQRRTQGGERGGEKGKVIQAGTHTGARLTLPSTAHICVHVHVCVCVRQCARVRQ